uniref:Uncharacterized protein n=1 Tax=Anopheles minimus TaxID=112268 RepID=A0A182VPW2_9DIPT
MPQRRGWRQPKQDHSVYVQQLFKDFLMRNNEVPTTAVPNDARTNFGRPDPNIAEQRKQPGIFDRAVYARFERNTNSGSFIRQQSTNRSKTGLMRWIDQQRNNRPQRNGQKVSRLDDYLNLPGNFFSGTEHMKLPFEGADRTIGNVTYNFVPPATSTPFDRMASFGVSGVLSDPEELQSNPLSRSKPTSSITSRAWEIFLKNCEEYLTGVTKEHERASELMHQRKELGILFKTDDSNIPVHQKDGPEVRIDYSYKATPTIVTKHNDVIGGPFSSGRDNLSSINQHYFLNSRTCDLMSLETSMEITDPFPVTLDDPIPEQDPIPIKHQKRNNVTFLIEPNSQINFKPSSVPAGLDSNHDDDILLTASPPSPNLSSSRRRCLYEESTFLLDRVPSDDTLMEKLDALLEDEEFNIQGNTDHEFDFCTPANQPTMNISFPSQLRIINNPTDDSIVANAEFTNTPLHSQDLMMAPTIQNFRELLF